MLALQLPFLFDGEISPERVEPDCDKAKRFEWNLLMGKHDDRLGYTWIEFERVDDQGTPCHLTLGCGARAAAGRGIVSKWFFITARRVGHDLSLCSPQSTPLSKDALIEALGDNGRVFLTASSYREEVNRSLFGLSSERYEALIKLLIELRQPKLSRHLDEKTLSTAMSDALTPVRTEIINHVGDAMRAMEQDRTALTTLQSAQQSTEGFLVEYRRYAQLIACRRSEEVRKSHSAYEGRHRKLRDAESDHANAIAESENLKTREEQLSLEMAAAQGRKTTLEASPEMRSARDLENALRQAEDRRSDANRATDQLRQSNKSLDQLTAEHEKTNLSLNASLHRMTVHSNESRKQANLCDFNKSHDAGTSGLRLPQPDDLLAIENSEKTLHKNCEARQADIRLLRDLNATVESGRHAWRQALDRRNLQSGRVAELESACQARTETVSQTVLDLSSAYRQWHASLIHLTPLMPQEVLPEIADWRDGIGPIHSPVRRAVEAALNSYREQAATDRAAATAERSRHEQVLRSFTDELDHLLQGQHQPPPVPYTRDAGARTNPAGAPLWQLCEFADHVSDSEPAALEAAMESAGLLDAWVFPDGTVDGLVGFDTILHTDGEGLSGPTLLDAVRPASDWPDAEIPPVAADIVRSILQRIGLGRRTGAAWVDVDGSWHNGILSGRWSKPSAEHIGQATREASRLRNIEQLNVQISKTNQLINAIDLAIAEIDDKRRSATAEAGRAPSDEAVRKAIAQRDALLLELDQAKLRLREDEELLIRAKAELQQREEHRDITAADLSLTNWVDKLQLLDDRLNDYRRVLVELWSAAREYVRVNQSVLESQARLNREHERFEQLESIARDNSEKAAAAEAHHQALNQTIGTTVQEVQHQLRNLLAQIEKLTADQKDNIKLVGAAGERIKQSATLIEELESQIKDETARRDIAINRLLQFAASGLIDLTEESLVGSGRGEMAVTAAVDFARRIDTALAKVDSSDNTWAATQRSIHNHIQNLTNSLQSHDYRPEVVTEEDTLLVTVPLRDARRSMRDFSAMLAEEIAQRRLLLTAKELALLENYLIQDVAVELGKLIRESEEMVAQMNRQLAKRPNSMGMMLRFNWEADAEGPPAFKDARKKLLGDYATWSLADRTALGQFLQEQINLSRETNPTSTWQEQLSTALDYRRWHTFYVERRQDNKWVRLTRKTHGTGSGGEKAVALTIPQFAAAAAYYDTASPFAPRLILLDEAFVGIDRDMRGKCMGLLHEFDLDFVMTSEIEWGCYQTIPGLAIYQLSAREGIDAVWASRWVWNGHERVQLNPIPINGDSKSPHENMLINLNATDEIR